MLRNKMLRGIQSRKIDGNLLHTLDNPNKGADIQTDSERFGYSVATSDSYAIVGAPYESDAGGGDASGKAYIFSLSTGNLVYTLDNPNAYDANQFDRFGTSVAISDSYAIVGAHNEADAGGVYSGKAYIFSASTGSLLHTLDNPNAYGTSSDDRFGFSVAITDSYAIVGAIYEGDAGNNISGKAYIFSTSTGNLLYTLDNPSSGSFFRFGYSVAISGDYAIVGALSTTLDGSTVVDGSGEAYIYDISTFTSSTISSANYVLDNPTAYGTSVNDSFGVSVAISGDYAIVGAYKEDDAGGTDSGKAYIYDISTFTTGTISSANYVLDNPNAYGTSAGDSFGRSVAINDSYAIVGAYQEDDAGGLSSGKAYIYDISTFTSSTISSANYVLDNPNAYGTSDSDWFGTSVAISGDYAIVGADGEDDIGSSVSGKAYIFSLSTGNLAHTLDNPNAYGGSSADFFGWSVAISKSYTIVGATGEDDAGSLSSGKAYIFRTSTGALLYTLDNPNAYGTSAGDSFGRSVAINDSYAIVGAYQEDDAGGTDSGKAYIFSLPTGNLLYTLDNPNAYNTSAGDFFGFSVAISDSYAIVGAYQEDDAGGAASGKAYIFSLSTGNLAHTLDNPNAYNTSAGDNFGRSVAISDSYAIVSAHQEDDAGGNNSGKAYIFDVTTGTLLHTLDNPNAYGTSAGDFFGFSVAISDSYAIVGAIREDEASGNNSGKAYIFSLSTGSLLHTLDNPNAYNTVVFDRFGQSVAISDSYAIVGANQEDDAGGNNSGKAYIFDVTTGNLLYTLDNPNAYGTSVSDFFGLSVAINDSYAIVSAYQEEDADGLNSGKVYIY